jgi:DMSO/TMAO reductase YedYZ molybdopterin-dependent catalytic subunit
MSSLPSAEMRITASLQRFSALAVVAFLAAVPTYAADEGDSSRVTTTLAVRGNVSKPMTLSVADLGKFSVLRIDDTRVVRAQGGAVEAARHFAGCLLRDVLNAAKLTESDRHDLRRTIIVATASDGYKAVFSWAELFNSVIGDGVLVVYERDGVPLGNDEGRIALLSLKDTRPGPRHVKWLATIDVVRVPD